MSERLCVLATRLERVERTILNEPQRVAFATQALTLRFPNHRLGSSDAYRSAATAQTGRRLGRSLAYAQYGARGTAPGGRMRRWTVCNGLIRMRRVTVIREEEWG